ncbi:MAG: hypothetical protein LBN36_05045 [Clostridiales Family XIII bacterium]|jgi:hypothetical protein|nr:hypothetical protein [Clostridiales Family XIII bacterium]
MNDNLERYFGENTESICNGLLANSPFRDAVEQHIGDKFPKLYDVLVNCMPPELSKNIMLYPWQKQINPKILRNICYRPRNEEYPLFVLSYRRSWNKISERSILISNKAAYLSRKYVYELSDIYRNYFELKKGRIYLKNFIASSTWERAAVQLIEAVMLIFAAGPYDGDILSLSGGTGKVIHMQGLPRKTLAPGAGIRNRSFLNAEIKEMIGRLGADNRERILYPDQERHQSRLENLTGKLQRKYAQIAAEEILFAVDTALVLDGKTGVIFGTKGIYVHELSGTNYIAYTDVSAIIRKTGQIYVNGVRIYAFGKKDIVLIAGMIMLLTLQQNKGFTSNIEEICIDRSARSIAFSTAVQQ